MTTKNLSYVNLYTLIWIIYCRFRRMWLVNETDKTGNCLFKKWKSGPDTLAQVASSTVIAKIILLFTFIIFENGLSLYFYLKSFEPRSYLLKSCPLSLSSMAIATETQHQEEKVTFSANHWLHHLIHLCNWQSFELYPNRSLVLEFIYV